MSAQGPKIALPTFATPAQALAIKGRADGPSATARAKPSTKGKIQCRTRVHRTASTASGMRTDRACSASIEAAALQGSERCRRSGDLGDQRTAPVKGGRPAVQAGVAHLFGTARQLIAADVR